MSVTPILGITEFVEGQDEPDVTINEAWAILEAIAVGRVEDKDLDDEPASPVDGQMWIVAETPSSASAWADEANNLALRINSAWKFIDVTGLFGLQVYVVDEDQFYYYAGDSIGWVGLGFPSS
jgi:hypothetical protein